MVESDPGVLDKKKEEGIDWESAAIYLGFSMFDTVWPLIADSHDSHEV